MPRARSLKLILGAGLYSLVFISLLAGKVQGADEFRTAPVTNDGKRWRIGYYEGGAYVNYPENLKAMARGLAPLGWIDEVDGAKMAEASDSQTVWTVLSKTKSDFLTFVGHAYNSAEWDDDLRAELRSNVIKSLRQKQLDLMIAMGTWAGQDLANDLHSVPVMVVSSSDPVKSGIVKSALHSGYDHVHARCDPNRYVRQVRLFHDIVHFKRLGIVYANSKTGRSYAAIEDISKVAEQRGFELVACEAPWSGVPLHVKIANIRDCHNGMASRIDALYLTVHSGIDLNQLDEILVPLINHKIPTWSQRGPQEVRHGALLSIARGSFGPVGVYHAEIMAKILNGASPGELNQIFEDPKKIAINLKTAKAIGFTPPKGLMKVADEIYR